MGRDGAALPVTVLVEPVDGVRVDFLLQLDAGLDSLVHRALAVLIVYLEPVGVVVDDGGRLDLVAGSPEVAPFPAIVLEVGLLLGVGNGVNPWTGWVNEKVVSIKSWVVLCQPVKAECRTLRRPCTDLWADY